MSLKSSFFKAFNDFEGSFSIRMHIVLGRQYHIYIVLWDKTYTPIPLPLYLTLLQRSGSA